MSDATDRLIEAYRENDILRASRDAHRNALTDLIDELQSKRQAVSIEMDKYTYNYYGAIEPGSVDPELVAIEGCLTDVINIIEARLKGLADD